MFTAPQPVICARAQMPHTSQRGGGGVTATAKRRRAPAAGARTGSAAGASAVVQNVETEGRSVKRRVAAAATNDADERAVHPPPALPDPGRRARAAPALAAAAVAVPSSGRHGGGFDPRLPDPPPASAKPPRPPRVVPEGLPPGTDYLELLLTTLDAEVVRREVGWIVDEVQLRHPRFDTRLLRVLRDAVAAQPPDFLLWRFMIIAHVFELPDAKERLASATPWHRLEPILFHWRDEFFVFANARHSYFEAANEQAGKMRAYVDWVHYTIAMRFDYLCHYDQGGRWTATIPLRLPQPLKPVGVAVDPRAFVRAPAAPPRP